MNKNVNYYAVIMAGGVGSRFWPISRKAYPKQFQDFTGSGESLLQMTFKRLEGSIPDENIMVCTNQDYRELVKNQLPTIDYSQILVEPSMQNTAPCILYASLKIKKRNPEAKIIVLPSDHLIQDKRCFLDDVEIAFSVCEKTSNLGTFGISPSHPHTGFGYIHTQKLEKNTKVMEVKQFVEKPNLQKAEQYVASGNYFWNTGIFIWQVKDILTAFEKYQPIMYELFLKGFSTFDTHQEAEFIAEHYPLAENISIDYAILEKSSSISLVKADFDWSDLGSWGALYDISKKQNDENVIIHSNTVLENATNNLIFSSKKKVVVVDGLKDYIIVDRDDVLLIYPKKKDQSIKQILKRVVKKFGIKFE